MQSVGEILANLEAAILPVSATALDAAELMHARRVGAVLVHSGDDPLAGIFTERDLMVRVVVERRDPAATPLGDVMTPKPFAVDSGARIKDVQNEMARRHIRHLPVLEEGRVKGMLSLRDLLSADLEEKSQEMDAITDYIRGGFDGHGD